MTGKISAVDRLVGWGIDRVAYARRHWKAHALDAEDRALVSSMLSSVTPADDPFGKMTYDDKMRKARTVSWIYSDIRIFANMFSGAAAAVKEKRDEQLLEIKNHPFELLLQKPNEYMAADFLWQYTIKWLMLSKVGAFWFLAPRRGDSGSLAEIWPIPSNKVTPVPDKEKLIRGYQYELNSGQRVMIDPRYIAHFRFPDPFSLLLNDVPLNAALLAMETEIGIGGYQKDTYLSGRGIPRSIISLPEDTGERDFVAIASQIREEFEQEQKLIITRGGDIKSTSVGFTQREMDLINQRNFTRDELDTVFLGFPINSATSEAELRQYYRMIKDDIIYPTHRLIGGQVTVQILNRFYGENLVLEFEDVRAQDRALNVQERNVYWRAETYNEARQDLGKGGFENSLLPGLGDLPVPLATDPAFVSALYGFSSVAKVPGGAGGLEPDSERRRASPNAAMSESDAPVNQLSDMAKTTLELVPSGDGDSHVRAAIKEGMQAELSRWEKVAVKEVQKGRNPGVYPFKTLTLPRPLGGLIRGNLLECRRDIESVKAVFSGIALDDYIELDSGNDDGFVRLVEELANATKVLALAER